MRKIFAITALLLILSGPVFAGSVVGETFLGYAGSGAGIGAAAGLLAGGLPGLVFGAALGAITGGIVGANVQQAQDDKTETDNTGTINQLALQNEAIQSENQGLLGDIDTLEKKNESLATDIDILEAEIEPQRVALAKWQDTYDTDIALQNDQASQGLKTLKENWGIQNAVLASMNRGGASARLLSQEQKDRVIAYAGEDMELNSDSIVQGVKDVYADEGNFDAKGNLTEAGAQKLALTGSQFGVFDKQMSQLAVDLMQEKKATETIISSKQNQIKEAETLIGSQQNLIRSKRDTIGLNEQAIGINENSIDALKKNNAKLGKRRWELNN